MNDASRRWAYGFCLAGGALILAGAATMALMWLLAIGNGWMWGGGVHMWGQATGIAVASFVGWGLITGTMVLVAGIRMRPGGPGDGTLEGGLAIAGSALSFPAMGGFMLGAVLGVIGGVLALVAAAEPDADEA